MRPGLQTPASVNVTCAAKFADGSALHVGLRYIKAPLANFAIRAG